MVWTHSATILWKTVVLQQYSNAHHPTAAWYTEARQDGCKLLCWSSSQCCIATDRTRHFSTFYCWFWQINAKWNTWPICCHRPDRSLQRWFWKMPNNEKLPSLLQRCISVLLSPTHWNLLINLKICLLPGIQKFAFTILRFPGPSCLY